MAGNILVDTGFLIALLSKRDSHRAWAASYSDVPMSLVDACLVRMTETLADPLLLSTDEDFRIYRRQGRLVIPCALPV